MNDTELTAEINMAMLENLRSNTRANADVIDHRRRIELAAQAQTEALECLVELLLRVEESFGKPKP